MAEFEPYEIDPTTCGNCGNFAKFIVRAEVSQIESFEYEEPDDFLGTTHRSIEAGFVYRTLICTSCKRATFDRVLWNDGEPESDETLYPEQPNSPDDLPERVAKEYRDALNERQRNPNAYASLLGRVLDSICTDRGIPTEEPPNPPATRARKLTLGPRLEKLIDRENLSAVRGAVELRNVAAHSDNGDLNTDEIRYIETLVQYVLDHIYVIPATNQRALDARRARTTAS